MTPIEHSQIKKQGLKTLYSLADWYKEKRETHLISLIAIKLIQTYDTEAAGCEAAGKLFTDIYPEIMEMDTPSAAVLHEALGIAKLLREYNPSAANWVDEISRKLQAIEER